MTPDELIARVERLDAAGDVVGALELVERELTDDLDGTFTTAQRTRLHATMHAIHEIAGMDLVDQIRRRHAASA
jgi:hypothetical protein